VIGGVSGSDQALAFIYLMGCLILAMSGLAVYRAPIGKMLKFALAWVLIFAAGFAVFSLRGDIGALGHRIAAAWGGGAGEARPADELRIAIAEDGHFWVDAELNGRPVRFLIDSGATITTIDRETAQRVGIAPSGAAVRAETGSGNVVVDDRGRAATLKLGPIERSDIEIAVARGNTINVIGMNLLSTLSRWSVEDRTLVLQP
jgi:aspartyl protease family protein